MSPDQKYHKPVNIKSQSLEAYVDFGSTCTTIREDIANQLNLIVDRNDVVTLKGYGHGQLRSLGTTESFELIIDGVTAEIRAAVVPNHAQDVPIMVGQNFTEQSHLLATKDCNQLQFHHIGTLYPIDGITPTTPRVILRTTADFTIPPQHLGNVPVESGYNGDVYICSSVRTNSTLIPNTVIHTSHDIRTVIPVYNLSDTEITLSKGQIIARGMPCFEDLQPVAQVRRVDASELAPISLKDVNVGDVPIKTKKELLDLINEYRDCFALSTDELGCAKSGSMTITLKDDTPFTYQPYRMAQSEQKIVQELVDDLLKADIIQPSESEFSSPVLLVQKKNLEQRLCIDYRRLNGQTVKDCHPLPRIDDQIDKLAKGIFFSSLDLKSGYYQILLDENSRKYTAFVTSAGQYEFKRMPFGLTNAPRVFQRFMNRILGPIRGIASIYLDDVLLHARTLEEALQGLRLFFELLREENLTLNLKKCSFLMRKVNFLGFEISAGTVRPGAEKTAAVEQFPVPASVHNVRQFIGLTGYFRHFVPNYATRAQPITALLRKDCKWHWTASQAAAFGDLKKQLCERPILRIFCPDLETEVHTDASALGLGGILLQRRENEKFHPVAYFSRQTHGAEPKYHSYELETLAVVETLKKFRPYLIGIKFVVITDCNSLKMAAKKKQLIPRIARWWLQLQEFTFDIEYRPGQKMQHVDALSRNPIQINKITTDDWVLASQLSDAQLRRINEVLSKPQSTRSAEERILVKNYTLKEGRIYRDTVRGPVWVVPPGMRHEVIRISHLQTGHCSVEKTMNKLQEAYWFPRMRKCVEKFIRNCIPCLYNRRKGGKPEGLLHPIPKGSVPLQTLHLDHVGPFVRSRKGNMHLLVAVDGFSKFTFLHAVKSTKTKLVIGYLRDIFATYGTPKIIITDQGTAFTSHEFEQFCNQNTIKHVSVAVATPRANGQVERLNRSILNALQTTVEDERRWDESIREVQFCINNTVNSSTKQTPSHLLLGYTPRGGEDMPLRDEIVITSSALDDIAATRLKAANVNQQAQGVQKKYYDERHQEATKYNVGDLVLIEKQAVASKPGDSRKLIPPFQGPMVVKEVLPNDRYRVVDMSGHRRTKRKTQYDKVIAADKMKLWRSYDDVDESSDDSSGSS
jgi:hypothetical protein